MAVFTLPDGTKINALGPLGFRLWKRHIALVCKVRAEWASYR